MRLNLLNTTPYSVQSWYRIVPGHMYAPLLLYLDKCGYEEVLYCGWIISLLSGAWRWGDTWTVSEYLDVLYLRTTCILATDLGSLRSDPNMDHTIDCAWILALVSYTFTNSRRTSWLYYCNLVVVDDVRLLALREGLLGGNKKKSDEDINNMMNTFSWNSNYCKYICMYLISIYTRYY